ncbi:hypothetical protein D3C71_1828430 [compost metagenome]
MHAEGMVGAGKHHAPHAVAARALVHRMQRDQVVVDDLLQRPLDAGAGHVDQHLHAMQQRIDHRRVAQIAMRQILGGVQRHGRGQPHGRAQIDAMPGQLAAQYAADMPAGPTQCYLGHFSSLRFSVHSPSAIAAGPARTREHR